MESNKQEESAPTNVGRAINEIRDGMADFETRILWCENMLTPSNISLGVEGIEPPKVIVPREHRLYNELQQLKARFIYVQNQINSLTDKKTKDYY